MNRNSPALFFGKQNETPEVQLTENGAMAFSSSMDMFLDFFSDAGSKFAVRKKSKVKFDNTINTEELSLFKLMWSSDTEEHKILSMKLLFWLRNISRSADDLPGAGNRSGFRNILAWLASSFPKWVIANIATIPVIGRWDDLETLFNTPCENEAVHLWATAISSNPQNGLACKWMPRKGYVNSKVARHLNLSPKQFRKLIVEGTKVVEQQMCKNQWSEINYSQVPSKAFSMLTAAFKRHDLQRFDSFNKKVANGDKDVKVNASAIFPHEIIAKIGHGHDALALRNQWNALPNYLKSDTNEYRVIAIADTSGSMSSTIGNSNTTAMIVSKSLALYCSDKISPSNFFYRKYMQFSSEATFTTWAGLEIEDVVNDRKLFNGSVGSTNVYKALMTILDNCKQHNIPNSEAPNMLLIISDMQFDSNHSERPVEGALKQFDIAGYTRPKVVFWNVADRIVKGKPVTKDEKGVCMVSGFSPSILKTVFSSKPEEVMTPLQIMLEAVAGFKINIPTV